MREIALALLLFVMPFSTVNSEGSSSAPRSPGQLNPDQFVEMKHLAQLPAPVQEDLLSMDHDFEWAGFADVGENWSPGCNQTRGVPSRRLIFAANSGKLWLVYYESGGVAHSYHLRLFQVVENKIVNVWSYIDPGMVKSLKELRALGILRSECFTQPPREVGYAGDEICYRRRSGT